MREGLMVAGARPDGGRRRGAVFVLLLAMLLGSLGTSIANIALPVLARGFGVSIQQVQWVAGAYLAALTVGSLIAGPLGDRLGRRCGLGLGLALFSVAALFAGLATDFQVLIAARTGQGLGAAFMMTLTLALVRDIAGASATGRVMGLVGTTMAVGTALGPSLGGVLLSLAGWQSLFLVLVPMGALAALLALALLPAAPGRKGSGFLDVLACRSWGITGPLIANALVSCVMMATLIVGPFYLGQALGLPKSAVGLVMSVGPVCAILSGVPSGWFVDRNGSGRVVRIGVLLLIAGAFTIAVLTAFWGLYAYVLGLVLLAPGYQLFQAANNTAVLAVVPEEQRGTGSGLLSLTRNLGLVGGAMGMGAVFAFFAGATGGEASAEALIWGMQASFLLAAALMLVTLWLVGFDGTAPRQD